MKKDDNELYNIKYKYKNIDVIEYSDYYLVNNRKFKSIEKAKEYIDDLLGITYKKKRKNTMKKRDSYNIYRGFAIKFYPATNTYVAFDNNSEQIAQAKSLKTIKAKLDDFDSIDTFNQGMNELIKDYSMQRNTKKRKNSAVRMNPAIDPAKYFANPLHFPKMASGRPRKRGRPKTVKPTKIFGKGPKPKIKWWLVSLYRSDGNLIKVLAGQGTKANVMLEAEKLSKKKGVARAELQGPYKSMPSVSTSRH